MRERRREKGRAVLRPRRQLAGAGRRRTGVGDGGRARETEGSGAAARILLQVRAARLLGPPSRRRWRQRLGARRQPSRCYGAWWSALKPQMLLLHPHHQPKNNWMNHHVALAPGFMGK